jgi:hypothetical protein
MKTIFSIGLMFAGATLFAQYNTQNLKLESSASVNQYVFENLQLYPIRANQTFVTEHKNLGNYVTLKDALEKKKVAITEYSGGSVNTLYIENISSDTVMILSGEVVQGGKQDRVIAQDFILPPRSGKKDVSVFCVEHGRWQTKKGGDMSFQEYFSISSNDVRKAATVNKNQQEVWKKVAETTEKNNASTSTGTLTALQNAGTLMQDLERYSKHFGKLFTNQADVIGVIVVAGDKILGCDMFATHEIFEKHYPNLLNSYATEAITSGKKVSVSYNDVNEYLLDIIKDESKQEDEVKKKGAIMKNGDKKVHISTFN